LPDRLYRGGLPQALLADRKQPSFFREWMDSFFARDIQRLFGFRDVDRFNAFFEYALRRSGGQLETARAARALGIARPTVESHLRALAITNAATLVRPFFGSGPVPSPGKRRHSWRATVAVTAMRPPPGQEKSPT
jgi:hypothetical protein